MKFMQDAEKLLMKDTSGYCWKVLLKSTTSAHGGDGQKRLNLKRKTSNEPAYYRFPGIPVEDPGCA